MYQQENEWAKGAAVLQPLIDEDPLNLEMQRQQAYFYLRAGDARNARDRFRALVQADPKDARSLFYLAESLNDLEEYAEAEKHLPQAARGGCRTTPTSSPASRLSLVRTEEVGRGVGHVPEAPRASAICRSTSTRWRARSSRTSTCRRRTTTRPSRPRSRSSSSATSRTRRRSTSPSRR